ncbi:unnamed protein product [Closterium sp. Naga37s-1]|nr:unnamed protein product [Closterium sp. Naga37s-1]
MSAMHSSAFRTTFVTPLPSSSASYRNRVTLCRTAASPFLQSEPRRVARQTQCRANRGGDIPDTDWMTRTDPWELLGVAEGSSVDEIKAAFRAKAGDVTRGIKNVHPDVYRGELDAEAITTRLVLAYELLLEEAENPTGGRSLSLQLHSDSALPLLLCGGHCQGPCHVP